MKPLYVYHDSRRVGIFMTDETLHLDFQYDANWLKQANSFPLSISLPLQTGVHRHPRPTAFLENLLPEQKIRRAIEQAHRLPQDSPYQFLKEFGEDIAGAFVISEQEEPPSATGRMVEVSLDVIEQAIEQGQQLYQSIVGTYGAKFSLAGAQDKFCVIYKENKIFVGIDGEPSTHIAKVTQRLRGIIIVL